MNAIKRFEDVKAWEDARVLTFKIYKICSDGKPSKDFGFRDQIQRASVSIMSNMSNIAEGFERNNNKEFVRFLLYSKGSCGEVRSLLTVANDLKYINDDEFKELHELATVVSSQIANFIKYLKKSNSIKP
ncbi:MAG: four helix bundle protein [Bacteroidota bacterium]|nr:four helix bundle protein [Bacteroidota bacterium]